MRRALDELLQLVAVAILIRLCRQTITVFGSSTPPFLWHKTEVALAGSDTARKVSGGEGLVVVVHHGVRHFQASVVVRPLARPPAQRQVTPAHTNAHQGGTAC